jgi:hypothetical protein
MSLVALATCAVPSTRNVILAVAGTWKAPQTPVAVPQPTSHRPSRFERGSNFEGGGLVHHLVDHGGELPRPLRAERDSLNRVRAVTVAGEHLRARIDDLDRALGLAGRHGRQRRVVVRSE